VLDCRFVSKKTPKPIVSHKDSGVVQLTDLDRPSGAIALVRGDLELLTQDTKCVTDYHCDRNGECTEDCGLWRHFPTGPAFVRLRPVWCGSVRPKKTERFIQNCLHHRISIASPNRLSAQKGVNSGKQKRTESPGVNSRE